MLGLFAPRRPEPQRPVHCNLFRTFMATPILAGATWLVPPRAESLAERFFRFARTLIVGSWATVADFAVLALCVRMLALDPALARAPALLAGALVQFFGCRSYAFRAQAGSVSRQAKLFVLHELVGMPLNLLMFGLLLAPMGFMPAEIVSLLANFVVFLFYSYPVRRFIVFSIPEPVRVKTQ
jgi:putative flippase GtrA